MKGVGDEKDGKEMIDELRGRKSPRGTKRSVKKKRWG